MTGRLCAWSCANARGVGLTENREVLLSLRAGASSQLHKRSRDAGRRRRPNPTPDQGSPRLRKTISDFTGNVHVVLARASGRGDLPGVRLRVEARCMVVFCAGISGVISTRARSISRCVSSEIGLEGRRISCRRAGQQAVVERPHGRCMSESSLEQIAGALARAISSALAGRQWLCSSALDARAGGPATMVLQPAQSTAGSRSPRSRRPRASDDLSGIWLAEHALSARQRRGFAGAARFRIRAATKPQQLAGGGPSRWHDHQLLRAFDGTQTRHRLPRAFELAALMVLRLDEERPNRRIQTSAHTPSSPRYRAHEACRAAGLRPAVTRPGHREDWCRTRSQ